MARSLSVVGDRWTLLVLREAFLGTRRFEGFRARTGATRPLLADRLRKLEAHGVLARVAYRERPRRFEYRLTHKGVDLYPVIAALLRWGDRWMAEPSGPPLALYHRRCGQRMLPELRCPECDEPLDAGDVLPHAGTRPAGPLPDSPSRGRAEDPRRGLAEPPARALRSRGTSARQG